MTKKERVLAAIWHKEADKVPKGDLMIEGNLRKELLDEDSVSILDPLQQEKKVRELLKMDIVMTLDYPAEKIGKDNDGNDIFRSVFGDEFKSNGMGTQLLKPPISDISEASSYAMPDIRKITTTNLDYYVNNTDLYVMAQIGGPVSMVQLILGMGDAMIYSMTDIHNVKILSEKIVDFEIERAKVFLDHGADAILLADDIAINTGLMYPPHMLKELAYPFYKRIVSTIKNHRNIPVFMHTDGDIRMALDDIVECGFDGIQSLQPSAGLKIEQIKKSYGNELCLMGNLDLNYLMTFGTPEEIDIEVRRVIEIAAPGGGFILSTCNILTDSIPRENALAMYEAAEKYGKYPIKL